MTPQRHDRIIPLIHLTAYPGREKVSGTFCAKHPSGPAGKRFLTPFPTLDMPLWLPQTDQLARRVWAMVPESTPEIAIDDATFVARRVSDGPPRWIDYGVVESPNGMCQLRVRGIRASECAGSYLVITTRTDLPMDGCSLEDAERALWGLARCDAGTTTLRPSRLTVGSPAVFRARYTAGPKGLPAGAMVRFAVPIALDPPQTDDPHARGFVSIAQADAEVRIVSIDRSIESHEKTDILCRVETGLDPFAGFEIRYRTDWTYIYACRFHETDRAYWYTKLAPLSAAAAVSDTAPMVSLAETNGHTFELAPGEAERLHLSLPGRRFTGEPLVLRGTFTDRYRNVPPCGPVDADIELWLEGGDRRIALGTPAGRLHEAHRFEVPLPALSPGVYRAVACRTGTSEPIARSNPLEIVPPGDGGDRVYWGEIHAHTEMSDGCGAYVELYRHARDEGCLDFAASGDHACYFSDNQWQWMQDVTNTWNAPGRFVTLVGYEWAGQQSHRNVYTSRDRLDLFRGMYPPQRSIDVVWQHFHGDDQIAAGPHAPLAHGLDWEFHDPSVERFVEVYSMWGASDSRDNPLVPEWAKHGPRSKTFNELLQTGAKLGFTGGGDCHEGHAGFSCEDPDGQGRVPHTFARKLQYRCGMTGACMPDLDRRCLIAALRNRQTYATTGARILLDFAVSDLPMGAVGRAPAADCRATVHAVEPVHTVEIVKDGRVVWSHEPGELDVTVRWQDPDPPCAEHYYYLHVVQTDGQMAWSSPVWVRPVEETSP